LSRYDRDKDYRISREEFLAQVHFGKEEKKEAQKPVAGKIVTQQDEQIVSGQGQVEMPAK
jgi:hypothetical protein